MRHGHRVDARIGMDDEAVEDPDRARLPGPRIGDPDDDLAVEDDEGVGHGLGRPVPPVRQPAVAAPGLLEARELLGSSRRASSGRPVAPAAGSTGPSTYRLAQNGRIPART